MLAAAIESIENMDQIKAQEVLNIEKKVNRLDRTAREANLQRMNSGASDPSTGIYFLDYISNLEKIGDHLSNVGIAVKREFHFGTEEEG